MKKMLIDDTQPEETRVVIVDGNKVEDVEFESSAKKQIKGNIFSGRITRIEPSLQAAFVDYGGNRHGFLAFGEIHPDYYNVSDEVRAEVEAEVDEIIERKRKYQAERKAEQERRRLEREQKRAEYEARRQAELEAEKEAETAETEDAEVAAEEEQVAQQSESVVVEEAHEEVEAHEENVPVEEAQAENSVEENTVAETDDGVVAHGEETCECDAEENCDCEQVTEEPVAEVEPIEANDAEEVSETESAEGEQSENEENNRPRGHRRSARFLGGRRGSRKYKVSAESAGIGGAMVAEEVDEETDNSSADEDDNFDDDEKTCREFDNDEDEADFEHYLEVQRKLIFARKLYYRSTIQDVIKEGQTVLIQVVKEERGNKGAACTTYLSLAGRYCVLMPNRIKSGGVSRKITSATDRKRLKDIMHTLPLNDNMSLIIRTAGEDKDKDEIVRDYNYLIRTWNHIRHSALSTPVPALIYEEGDLIKRALRDMYSKDISEVIIDGDEAYQNAKEFAKILSPNLVRKIKCRKPNDIPVFQQYQVEKELDKLHNPVVQLQSGGYLVINPTEALVSIDVNSGRATHEMDIEETALKTNLEAADEIAKQLRMRNLAGLVVVDFIDMEEPANNHAVEKRMKEAMKPDRARVQIAKMSIFGLLEISRQRMHSSFMESNYVTCPFCKGQGVIRSAESSSTLILRALEEEGIRGTNNHFEVKLPSDIAVYMLNQKRRNLADLEEKYGIEIVISADLSIKNINDYRIEKSRVAKARPERVAATAAYAAAEPVADEDYDEAEDETDETETEEEDTRSSERYNRRGGRNNNRRRGRYNNRRGGRYSRRDNDEGNENPNHSDAVAESSEEATEPKKKTTWWKKLIG